MGIPSTLTCANFESSSCPGLSRASMFWLRISARKTWMAGTSPAMTENDDALLRRQHGAADQFAFLQIGERFVGFRERHRRHRNRCDHLVANEFEQFLGFAQI